MSVIRTARRPALAAAAALTAMAVGAAPAMAHHCFVPMYTLSGPTSPNWFVVDAETGAYLIHGYQAGCEEAVDAGYAALEAAGQPVAIKIFEKMTIGDPKETGRTNPNGSDGRGLEYFGAGSTVADEMVDTWLEAAQHVTCPG
jgi:hypothetical protein